MYITITLYKIRVLDMSKVNLGYCFYNIFNWLPKIQIIAFPKNICYSYMVSPRFALVIFEYNFQAFFRVKL